MKRPIVIFGIIIVGLTLLLLPRDPKRLAREAANTKPVSPVVKTEPSQTQTAAADKNIPATKPVSPSGNVLLLKKQSFPAADPRTEVAFAKFDAWLGRYQNTDASLRSTLTTEGVTLARARREAMSRMIRENPERALQLAVSFSARQSLPPSVTSLLEDRVSGRGNLRMQAALPLPGKESEVAPNSWSAEIGSREYQTYVYGRRLGEPTRFNIPLHGVAVDNVLAASEDPVRVLEPEEAAIVKAATRRETFCGVSSLPTGISDEETIVEVGGDNVYLCHLDHASALNGRLAADENDTPPGDPEADDGPQASTWTEGVKDIIFIRVDFSDKPGAPFTDATGINLISNLHNFYTEMSFGRTTISFSGQGSDLTPTFRMPQPAAYYGTNYLPGQLRTDARAAATAAGYILGNYNRDVIMFDPVPGFSWSGLANVGAAGAWLNGTTSTGTAAHELGHNWGLNHANYWDTDGESTIGAGTSVEYGDIFDTMGKASAGNNHFNARYKVYLNWLTSSDYRTVSAGSTNRIYCHDNTNSTGLRALRIVKNSSTNYWVEFRQKFTANKWLMSGAGLRWAQSGNQRSQLLDTTPGSKDGKDDAAIVIGRTFSDKVSGIHITPIGKGGTIPESLDVVVNLGSFPANVPPTVTLNAPVTNAATGATLNFSVNASDSNGDALAYYWDFGDGNFGTNGPAAAKSWSSAGEYLVRCIVSDMKGGLGIKSTIVRIGSPSTFRIGGQLISSGGPVVNARVFVSSTLMTYTDGDGNYNLVGLPAGTYTVGASLEGYSFATVGFTNPVAVGPNRAGINFIDNSSPFVAPSINAQPQNQTVYEGQDATFTVGVIGSAPLSFQWRYNNTNIAGATQNSYTRISPVIANSGNYSVVVTNTSGSVTSHVATLTVLPIGTSAFVWDGGANDGIWQPGASQTNWVGDTYLLSNSNRANYVFTAPAYSGGTTVTLKNSAPDVGNLKVNADSPNLTLTVDGTGGGRLDLDPLFSGAETVTVENGDHLFSPLNAGKVRLQGQDEQVWDIAGTASLTVSATIEAETATNGLTKTGEGTLALSVLNTYGGKTRVLEGTVSIVTPGCLGALPASSTPDQITLDGGRLHVLASPISSGANRGFTFGANGAEFEVDAGVNYAMQAFFSGPGGFIKTGLGTLDITAASGTANTFAGKVGVYGGTLRINSINKLGTAPAALVPDQFTLDSGTLQFYNGTIESGATRGYRIGDNGGTFNVEGADTLGISGPISGTGGLLKLGTGRLQLNSPDNLYVGDTVLQQGSLGLDGDATLGDGSGTLYLNGGTLVSTGTRNTSTGILPNPIVMNANTVLRNTTDAAAGTRIFPLGANSLVGSNGTLTLQTVTTNAAIINTFSPRFTGSGFNFTRPIVFDNSTAANPANHSVQLELFSSNSAPAQIFSGVISGPGRVRRGSLFVGDAGTTVLAALNTYTVGTSLDRGYLGFGTNTVSSSGSVTAGPVGTGILTVNNDEQIGLFAWGGPRVVENYIILNSVPNTLIFGTNALTLAGPISLGAATTKTLTISNTALTTFSGPVTNSAPFVKTGPGTLVLSGNNTYSGGTTISEGALLVNSGTGSGTVTVNAAGTLGGTGSIAGAVTGAGNIAPGASAGTLTLQAGLNLSSGGTYVWELAAHATNNPGVNFDQLSLTGGNLVLGGSSKLSLQFIGGATAPNSGNPFWQLPRSWRIVALNGGANPGNTTFATILNATNAAGSFSTSTDAGGVLLNFTPSAVAPAPVLSATIAGAGTASAVLTWTGTAGLSYQVQYKNDLNATNWTTLGSTTATNGIVYFTDSTGPVDQRFYRVITP